MFKHTRQHTKNRSLCSTVARARSLVPKQPKASETFRSPQIKHSGVFVSLLFCVQKGDHSSMLISPERPEQLPTHPSTAAGDGPLPDRTSIAPTIRVAVGTKTRPPGPDPTCGRREGSDILYSVLRVPAVVATQSEHTVERAVEPEAVATANGHGRSVVGAKP